MAEPRETITYLFPVTVTVTLEGGAHEHYPTESEAQAALASALNDLEIRAKYVSYDARAWVGEGDGSSRGLVP